MSSSKRAGMSTSQMLYKGSIIGVMITVPSLVAFMLTWHFSAEIILAAGVGAGVHIVALVGSFKVAKKFLAKQPPQD